MKTASWKEAADLIGIAATVASLVFVGLQMSQSATIAISELNVGRIDQTIEARSVPHPHAAIRRRGNAGETLDSTEAAI